ncbi:cation:proton antiporter, partial [Jatrophihabitans endophyticus]|uniref:cation:proton antiporter n=1 Tax=Jatrophihabitans endophyticus TaxID=1206085 RepID=UPI0019F1460C
MTTHDIQLMLVDLALILVLARVLGAAAKKIGQPQVVGEVVAGILLGPTFFHGAITTHLFPAELTPVLTGIADVGLVLFMFIVGYELDASLVRGRERQAASISLGSIAVPLAAGFGLGWWLAAHNGHGGTVPFALFVGASMSVTAFPVLARILTDRGLHRTRLGGLAIASAAVDDVAAWTLLAVVVTVAGVPGVQQWHILFAPLYLLVMALVVRPLLRRVGERAAQLGRLTPDVLAVVLVVLLLSAVSTEWMGVHFIFGAFIAGAVMPRESAEALRQAILERLEQVSVLLLLPVFFVVSGLAVNLSTIDGSRLGQLLAILGVAIGGKFVGAYLGGRSAGVPNRQAGALATLMNTRGLTELIILNVGLQNGVIQPPLFTLLVVMAVVTTAMTGPLLRLVYPERLINRDIADAARASLEGAAYRVLVLLAPEPDPVGDPLLVRSGVDLAAGRVPAQVVVVRLLAQRPAQRLEVGTGLGTELMLMTRTMAALHDLGAAHARPGVTVTAYARFSEDVAADVAAYVIDAAADLVVAAADVDLPEHDLLPRIVRPGPRAADSIAV